MNASTFCSIFLVVMFFNIFLFHIVSLEVAKKTLTHKDKQQSTHNSLRYFHIRSGLLFITH